jgi:hypothetical protein
LTSEPVKKVVAAAAAAAAVAVVDRVTGVVVPDPKKNTAATTSTTEGLEEKDHSCIDTLCVATFNSMFGPSYKKTIGKPLSHIKIYNIVL